MRAAAAIARTHAPAASVAPQLSLVTSRALPCTACGWVLTPELRAKGCVGHMCGEKFVPVREGGAP